MMPSRVLVLLCLTSLCVGQETVPVGKNPVYLPPSRSKVGLVLNIDLASEKRFAQHFEIADGWASYVRIGVGMDQEGWHVDPTRWQFTRMKRLGETCAQKGLDIHLVLGGMPAPSSQRWQGLEAAPRFSGLKYSEMPKSWWPTWAAWQRSAVIALKKAYGPSARSHIRVQLPNEPFSRGEDAQFDEFMGVVMPLIKDSDGTICGLPMDGPSLWGPPAQLESQIRAMKLRMARQPEVYGSVQQFPLNVYLPASDEAFKSPERMTSLYISHGLKMWRLAQSELGRPAYFSEVGVSRVYDVWPQIYGSRQNDVAVKMLFDVVRGFRAAGVGCITIYQSIDSDMREETRNGMGLADSQGKMRVSLSQLRAAFRS